MKDESPLQVFAKRFATVAAALSIIAGGGHDADAASSGGRMGGRSFSAPARSYSAPARSYSAPARSQQYYNGPSTYRSSTTILPVPMPMPMAPISPFYGGGGFYGGPSVVVSGGGFNPIFDLIVVGGVVVTASSLLRGQRSAEGSQDDWDTTSSGALGNGVSVVKLQLALSVRDRSDSGFLGQLKAIAERAETGSRGGLSAAVGETCMALLRRQNDWVAANSKFEYFKPRSSERAEAVFNSYAIDERSKVERETVARFGGEDLSDKRSSSGVQAHNIGMPTQAVVTVVLALRGESLRKFQLERRINSVAAARGVLSQLAADVATDDGDNVLGAEILWTPEEPWESLDKAAVIEDFPELIDL